MYTLMLYSLKVGACLAVFYLFFKSVSYTHLTLPTNSRV